MSESTKELLIVVFGGPFGIHKFLNGDIKMGILYLCTFGLFGIGWIKDIIKTATGTAGDGLESIMSDDDLDAIDYGELPEIDAPGLRMARDEFCCYKDRASTSREKRITTGYTGKGRGISVRVSKGVSYHTGGHDSRAIRQTERITYNGVLYLTTDRIIFVSSKDSFDKTLDKISSIHETGDGLIVQFGSNSCVIRTRTHAAFMKAYNLVLQEFWY